MAKSFKTLKSIYRILGVSVVVVLLRGYCNTLWRSPFINLTPRRQEYESLTNQLKIGYLESRVIR